MVKALGNGLYDVASSSRELSYVVKPGVSCTCPHNQFRGAYCKHLRAVDEVLSRLEAKAAGLPDERLAELLAKYEAAGRADIAAALKGEQSRRARKTHIHSIIDHDAPTFGRSVKVYGPNTDAEAFGGV
jgi:uncharacterized Zn finger protein